MKISKQKRLNLIRIVESDIRIIRQDGWQQKLASFDYYTDWAMTIVDTILNRLKISVEIIR